MASFTIDVHLVMDDHFVTDDDMSDGAIVDVVLFALMKQMAMLGVDPAEATRLGVHVLLISIADPITVGDMKETDVKVVFSTVDDNGHFLQDMRDRYARSGGVASEVAYDGQNSPGTLGVQ